MCKDTYKLRPEKKEELQGGRTIQYIANISGCSRCHLSKLFNRSPERNASKKLVITLLNAIAQDSLAVSTMIKKKGINKTIDYFFEKI